MPHLHEFDKVEVQDKGSKSWDNLVDVALYFEANRVNDVLKSLIIRVFCLILLYKVKETKYKEEVT